MIDEKQETIADIVTELRRQSDEERALATRLRRTDDDVDVALAFASCYDEDGKYLSQIANRLEAALKREKAATEADALAVGGIVEAERHKPGDTAALREALEAVRKVAAEMKCGYASKEAYGMMIIDGWATRLIDIVDAALAAPLRNCDVGTAEEQAQRFHYFCTSNQSVIDGMCQPTCPCIDCPDKCHCLMLWAQMPYEKGGAK